MKSIRLMLGLVAAGAVYNVGETSCGWGTHLERAGRPMPGYLRPCEV